MYAIQKTNDKADIYIYGDISTWASGWGSSVSADLLVKEIKALGDVAQIDVHIDTYGGSVSEGWAIYNALMQTKAKIRTFADGFVASAGLYPFLAGEERIANSVSAFFLHEVLTSAQGYAKDFRKVADELEKMTEIGINAFVERAGMERDKVKELMDGETWLDASEAYGYGIATSVKKGDDTLYGQSAKDDIINCVLSAHRQKAADPQNADPQNEPQEPNTEPQTEPTEPTTEPTNEPQTEQSIFGRFKNSI